MESLAFQGLKAGGERIPDSAFEKIPFAGPKYFKEDRDNQQRQQDERQERRRNRDRQQGPPRSDRDDYYNDRDSEYEAERRARRSHRRSAREDRRRHNRGYDSDPESPAVSRGHNDRSQNENEYPYFPPPPTQAVNEPDMHNQQDSEYNNVAQSYVPEHYDRQPDYADNSEYAPPPGPPPGRKSRARFDSGAELPRNNASSSHSSAADRYRPHYDYNSPPNSARYDQSRGMSPDARGVRDSPRPNYPSAVAIRSHSPYYGSQASYDSRYDEEEDERRHRRKQRASSKDSRHRSTSRFSVGEVREKAQEGFKQHKGEIGAGALGALAGGILGREFGGSKKGNLGMVIGAALGGVGAGLYGARQEKSKGGHRARDDSRHGRREYAGYESY